MNYCEGIDLGSTTTKAVILAETGEMLGRGITNSRSNYKVACDIARGEALINARFGLLSAELRKEGVDEDAARSMLEVFALRFREQQYQAQLKALERTIVSLLAGETMGALRTAGEPAPEDFSDAVKGILKQMMSETRALYAPGARRKSDFFRDLAGSRYLELAEQAGRARELNFDTLAGLFDKAILEVENLPFAEENFASHARAALAEMDAADPALGRTVERVESIALEKVAGVGTGYGRRTLPFAKDCIRSEILCHGLGAHAMFPATKTVLDIGGQDTKAIQVDEKGIVTSFQMNDRCAAGCGRYLGYIADEMNVGVHELGPMACQSSRPVRINSTCTVFAGAELRERLSLGEKREDILAGLHRAIILRAMSLLARSGGVADEFTFTGGVAKNEAAVGALRQLIADNYGELKMNISPDSIYTGALGAAMFAMREWQKGTPIGAVPEGEA